jgi:hypothetical protein
VTSYSSLEALLQTLLNTPETEKGALLCSLLKTLREACGLFKQSSFSESQEAGKKVQEILDEILSNAIETEEEEWEEDEFSDEDSNDFIDAIDTSQSRPNISIPTASTIAPVQVKEEPVEPEEPMLQLISEWNHSVDSWLQLPKINIDSETSIKNLVRVLSALRHNITSNTFENQANILSQYDSLWNKTIELLRSKNYSIVPESWDSSHVTGRIIYVCRPRITSMENELICPGINYADEILQDPIWLVNYPVDMPCPTVDSRSSLPNYWRGILGEFDLLLEHIQLQYNAFAAIEGINKNKVETLEESRDNLLSELTRRSEVLESTVQKDSESLYRLATDYWRIEECFWSIFHDDDRPNSCSIFDKLRNRLQSWRPVMRKNLKLHIRDFAPNSDSLASINQYIGNIIIKPKASVNPGTVLRELRPVIMVKVQNTNRVLKGRVIAT